MRPTKFWQKSYRGFSLIELMIVLLISAMLVTSIAYVVNRGRRTSKTQRLQANVESLTQISFFIMGRDIRRAGSNPAGALGYDVGAAVPLATASENRIEILADLDGDGSISAGTEEQITYEFVDGDGDGTEDEIRRQAGNELVIENVKRFDLCYQLASTNWNCAPPDTSLIRKVRMEIEAGTGRINPDTGEEFTKDIRTHILLRNFR